MSKDNKYKERAKKLLENTYPEIKDKVEILDANKIKELRDILNKYGDEIKGVNKSGKVNIFLVDLDSLLIDFYNCLNINI